MKKGEPISYYCLNAEFYDFKIVNGRSQGDPNRFKIYIYSPYEDLNSFNFIKSFAILEKEIDSEGQITWCLKKHGYREDISIFFYCSLLYYLRGQHLRLDPFYITDKDSQTLLMLLEQEYISFKEKEYISDPEIIIKNSKIVDYNLCNILFNFKHDGAFQVLLSQMVRNHKRSISKFSNEIIKVFWDHLYYVIT